MTYTFKLARRLAISRVFGFLPVLLVFAACGGDDATAPEGSPAESPVAGTEWRPRDIIPVAVLVNPSSVTLETNQLIHFRAYGRNSAGDSVGAAVKWSTTGGTILPDGRFSAAAIGTYAVTGTNRAGGRVQVDTARVTVVRRQPKLASLEVNPTSTSLVPGVSQTFVAVGRLPNGSPVPIGVNWSAGGGSIDAGGTYVAGDTAGTYKVVASNTAGTLADTAIVTISAPPAPPPPAPAPPPTLAKLILVPANATLATSATRQFGVYGRTANGDSLGVSAVFTATGGTITAGGLYTAGSTPGSFRVIATSGGFADTSGVKVTAPLGSGTTGIPFGPWAGWEGTRLKPNTEVFTGSIGSVSPDNILAKITAAKSNRVKLIIAMTGGSHSNYMSTIDGVYKFDPAKWKAKMNAFNTAAIKTAVAAAIADGTIIGNSVMDEPHVAGGGVDGNTWGPSGTMTKARVDSLCGYVKSIFPTLPAGVVHRHDIFQPDKSYRVCDFIVSQYSVRLGSVTAFRDGGLAMARRDGMAIAFSMNIINGGTEDQDATWDCAGPGSNGKGQKDPKCRMTAAEVREFGLVLAPAGCAFTMWQYDSDFMSRTENQQAFKDIAIRLASAPARSCRRP